MNKSYFSLGLMSGTSGDGVDASIIQSDGDTNYKVISDQYFKYNQDIYENIHNLKDKINSSKDLNNFTKLMESLEKEITIFHAKAVNEIITASKVKIDFIGFHGQTIFHNSKEKISIQLGDGKLLSELTKKTVVYNFRKNDLSQGGEGAPLSPIFHKLLVDQNKINLPVCVLNIGGIANITVVGKDDNNDFLSRDLGPGNCLIDEWIRKNSQKKYDIDGNIARLGKINKDILNKTQNKFNERINQEKLSFDTKDFDLSFFYGLSLEDGAASITAFTGRIISEAIVSLLKNAKDKTWKILVCGGGRKNKTLMDDIKISSFKNLVFQPIDDYGINGDFIESQAFAYLAIRSYLKLPISFPKTTGVSKPCTGGLVIKN